MPKKVLLKKDTVDVNNVSGDKYYGVIINGNKGFVCGLEDFLHSDTLGRVRVLCITGFTKSNGFGWEPDTLKNLLAEVLKYTESVVWEFDTPKELFSWLVGEI